MNKLGNPHLGKADTNQEAPWMLGPNGEEQYQLSTCGECGGYYAAQCPCWFREPEGALESRQKKSRSIQKFWEIAIILFVVTLLALIRFGVIR